MRKRFALLSLVVAMLGLTAVPAYADPYDPNESSSQAFGPLTGGQDYNATFDTENDTEWFYFNVSGEQQLDISYTPTTNEGKCDMFLALYDVDGRQITEGNYASFNEIEHIRYSTPASGQYLLRALRQSGVFGCNYRFKVEPAAAVIKENPGVVATIKPADGGDDVQRVFLNGTLLGTVQGSASRSFSLGRLTAADTIVFEAQNASSGYSWDVAITNTAGRSRTAVLSETRDGSESRIGMVRRVVMNGEGAVRESCGEAFAPSPCFPRDSDSDGISDDVDQCTDSRGIAPTGCPDGDGDGIVDRDDKCSSTKGSATAAGCPDADGDGIVDESDRCARLAGPAPGGCPAKQRLETSSSLRRIGRRWVGRIVSGPGCTNKRRVILRRVGSGKRSFGSSVTTADGSFTIVANRRRRGRFYVVVAERGNKTKLCKVGTSRRLRG